MNTVNTSKTQEKTFDIYQEVTNSIIDAIEAGVGRWKMPWYSITELPRNVESTKEYRGINTLILWCQSIRRGYLAPEWGTYRQWSERHAQVRKGEKSTLVVFWKVLDRDKKLEADEAADIETETAIGKQILFARGYRVFNAEQVNGYHRESRPERPRLERIAIADQFFDSLGGTVRQSDHAAYQPRTDEVLMPPIEAFIAAEPYYSCLAHEYTHWTGASHRLNRSLSTRFGSEAYAAAELIAELGAAFLCATFGFSTTHHADHAAYIQNWLTLLKNDKKAIFNAAAHAQKAADYLRLIAKRNQAQTA
jgi:antirestriction protein ArdC